MSYSPPVKKKKSLKRLAIFNGSATTVSSLEYEVNSWIENNIDNSDWKILDYYQTEVLGAGHTSMTIYIWYSKTEN